MKFGWFNWINGAVVAALIAINLIAAKKGIAGRMESRHPVVNVLEQVGRYGCMAFMVLPIAVTGWEFGFASVGEAFLWLSVTLALLLVYGMLWVIHGVLRTKKKSGSRAVLYGLAIVPVCLFLFNGVILRHILLVAASILFGVCHLLIVWENGEA